MAGDGGGDGIIEESPAGRGVAQPGSAPALGAGGRQFESGRPDHSQVTHLFATFAFGAPSAPVANCGLLGFLEAPNSYKIDYIALSPRTISGSCQETPRVCRTQREL